MKRWKAVIEWSKPHPVRRDHAASTPVFLKVIEIEEVSELQGEIEGGPDWRDAPVIDIQLRYQR